MIKIDKKIPIPDNAGNRGRRKYPLGDMAIGDSFFVAGANVQRLGGTVYQYAARYNKRFVCRSVTENGNLGVRVWRIE